MIKKIILHGITAGLLSAISCLVYSEVYTATTGADFSSIISILPVMAVCLIGCLIAAGGYIFLHKTFLNTDTCDVIFNISFVFLTFISCIYPLSFKLSPFEYEAPALFNGLVVPMHFFPVLFWIALNPLFKNLRIK